MKEKSAAGNYSFGMGIDPFTTTAAELGEGKPSWHATLELNARWLKTVIFSRVRSSSHVDEIFQEVAFAAIKQSPRIASSEQASAWLYRVAVLQSLLFLRKQGRLRRQHSEWSVNQKLQSESFGIENPLAWLVATERQELVRQALLQLPERDAEMLLLKYTEDWSYCEMAVKLGISQSAVQMRLHRAREKIRMLLAKVGIEEAIT